MGRSSAMRDFPRVGLGALYAAAFCPTPKPAHPLHSNGAPTRVTPSPTPNPSTRRDCNPVNGIAKRERPASLLPGRAGERFGRGAGFEGQGRVADAPHGAAVAFAAGVGDAVVDRQLATGERPRAFDVDRLARLGFGAAVVAGDDQRRAGVERDQAALAEGVEVERRRRVALERSRPTRSRSRRRRRWRSA